MKIWYLALAASLLLASGSARAAPAEQLECAYDNLNGPTMMAIAKIMQSKNKNDPTSREAQAKALMKPVISKCAKRFGWNETDIENANRHYMIMSLEQLFRAALKLDGVDTELLDTLYKVEPLSRAEMTRRFAEDGEVYRAEWIEKIRELETGAETEEQLEVALLYIEMRLTEENLAEDFENGVLREAM
jgi:transketolase